VERRALGLGRGNLGAQLSLSSYFRLFVFRSGIALCFVSRSFAVVLYEMLTGSKPSCTCKKSSGEWCPFGSRARMEENASKDDEAQGNFRCEVNYPPSKISAEARALMEALFVLDHLKRLGSDSTGGIAAIKSHPYFSSIDWDALLHLEVDPPWVPPIGMVHADSLAEVEGDRPPTQVLKRINSVTLGVADEVYYREFDYVSPSGIDREILEALRKLDGPDEEKKEANGAGCCVIL
jgi:serine/threonine protein kinase